MTAGMGRAALAAALLAGGLGGPARALGECKRLGTPSFTADRLVTIDGHAIRSKVTVAGAREREEFEADGRPQVRLVSPGRIVTFDPQAGTGRVQTFPKPPTPPKGSLRIETTPEGEDTAIAVSVRNKAGAWEQLTRTVCRKDGVPLSGTFTAPVAGAKAQGTVALSNVVVGPVDPARFAVPGNVRLTP